MMTSRRRLKVTSLVEGPIGPSRDRRRSTPSRIMSQPEFPRGWTRSGSDNTFWSTCVSYDRIATWTSGRTKDGINRSCWNKRTPDRNSDGVLSQPCPLCCRSIGGGRRSRRPGTHRRSTRGRMRSRARGSSRLLRALASFGVVAETSPARFVLTPYGKPLRKDAPDSAWAGVVFWADLLADSWTYLTECIRTGQTAMGVRPAEYRRAGRKTPMLRPCFAGHGHGARARLHGDRAEPGTSRNITQWPIWVEAVVRSSRPSWKRFPM